MGRLVPLIVVTLLSACQQQVVKLNQRSLGCAEASSDKCKNAQTFSVSAPKSANVQDAVVIRWDSISNADSYDLVISRRKDCSESTLTIFDIKQTAQSIKLSEQGSYYICVFANLSDGTRSPAKNSGFKISIVESDSESSFSMPSAETQQVSQLIFSVQPSDVAAATIIDPSVKVALVDASGQVVTSANATITLSLGANPGSGTLSGTISKVAVSGIATFDDLKIDKIGTGYTLSASAADLDAVTSDVFDITVGSAFSLNFSVQPTDSGAGLAMNTVKVTAYDAGGNVAAGFAGDVTIAKAAGSPAGTLSGTLTMAAVAGIATFSDLAIDTQNSGFTFEASSSGLANATSDSFNVTSPFCGGDGLSVGTAYEICTVAQLQLMNSALDAHYKLANNIDASATSSWNSGAGFDPIGSCGADGNCGTTGDNAPFTGSFDGNGYKITDLYISRAEDGVGFVGVAFGATITRLAIEEAIIKGEESTGIGVGRLDGSSTMSKSYSTGQVEGINSNARYVGGLVGKLVSSTLQTSFSRSTVIFTTSGIAVGGLVGGASGGSTVQNCFAIGTMIDPPTYSGGLVGRLVVGNVIRSYADIDLSSTASAVGGLIGRSGNSNNRIEYSYATGNVRCASSCGGLVGQLRNGQVNFSFATGNVQATENDGPIGGLVGWMSTSSLSVKYSFSSGRLSGVGEKQGGLVGSISNGTISDSFWHDHSENPTKCVADIYSSTISRCVPKYNGVNPSLKPVSFAPEFKAGRKIGHVDEGSFRVWGQCAIEGSDVNIGVGMQQVSATCINGKFSGTVNTSSLGDGTQTVTLEMEGAPSGCNSGSTCYTVSRSVTKDVDDASFSCNGVGTNGNGFAAVSGSSDGTSAATPWVICTAAHLDNVRNYLSAGVYFKLGNNIDASSDYLGPIGTSGDDFNGHFDGNGFRVENLFIVNYDNDYQGLFGYIDSSTATISNLTIENAIIVGRSYIGAVVGSNPNNSTSFTNNHASGHVLGTNDYIGGLVGWSYFPSFTHSSSYVHVMGLGNEIGGAIGRGANGGGGITMSSAHAPVLGANDTGGLIGELNYISTLAISYAANHVIGTTRTGGLVGRSVDVNSTIDLSYARGNVITDSGIQTGGFIGQNNGVITRSFAQGNTIGHGYVGGFVGSQDDSSASINQSFANGDIFNLDVARAGGFAGLIQNGGTITNSYATGNVYSQYTWTGGFVGQLMSNSTSINACFATGNVYAYHHTQGGFVGIAQDSSTIKNSFATGNVQSGDVSKNTTGGFAGSIAGNAVMTRTFSQGHVLGAADNTGGYVGKISSGAEIHYAFSAGKVSAVAGDIGGFAGEAASSATSSDLFWHNAGGTNQSGNCIGNDATANLTCMEATNPLQKSFAEVGFSEEFKDGRKVGASDQKAFRVRGHCNDWTATIVVTAVDGSANSTTNSAACLVGSWELTLDVSGLDEGTDNITVTAEEQDGVCTPSSTCTTATRTISKLTTVCEGVYSESSTPASGFVSGGGVSGNEYIICTAEQLANVNNYRGSGIYFKLANNIDLNNHGVWAPLGRGSGSDFNGKFNGDGYRVSNMRLKDSGNALGLFGTIEWGSAEVKNIGVEDYNITGQNSLGGVVGELRSGSDFGNNYAKGNITGNTSIGGLYGYAKGGNSKTNSFALSNIIAISRYNGGISGYETVGIANSYAVANITTSGDGRESGGLLGTNDLSGSSLTVSNSFAKSNLITSARDNGGLVGRVLQATITNCYANGNILSHDEYRLGGLAGMLVSGSIDDSYSTGNVLSNGNKIGGLVGETQATVTDSFATGIASGATNVGGAIGLAETTATVTNVHYHDHANNPNATCIASDSSTGATCSTVVGQGEFYNQSPSSQNAPIDSWTFDAGNWEWDPSYSVFPILGWQND